MGAKQGGIGTDDEAQDMSMDKKPSYEELEQRIVDLEAELEGCRDANSRISEVCGTLRRRVDMEKRVSAISSRFIRIGSEGLGKEIRGALRELGKFVGADRAYLRLLPDRDPKRAYGYEWYSEGLEPTEKILERLSEDPLAQVFEKFRRFRPICVSRVADMGPEAEAEKKIWKKMSVLSVLGIPLFMKKRLVGFMGFNAERRETEWSRDDIVLLRLAGDVFVNVLERQKIEAEWRKFRFIADGSKTLMAMVNRDYVYEAVNLSYLKTFGKREEEIVGRSVAEVWGADVFENRIGNRLDRCFAGEEIHFEEWLWFESHEKGHGYYDISGSPYSGDKGEISHALVFLTDITERRRDEEQLLLFKTVVEHSNEAIAISDTEGRLVYINPAHERLFGRSLEEARNMNYLDYYPPESVEMLEREVAPALARGESWEGVLDVFDSEGRRFTLWERADTVRDKEGNMRFAFGLMHDDTERIETEKAVLRAKEEWERTFDALPDMIFIVDREHRILRVNKSMADRLALSPDECVGQKCFRLVHESDCLPRECPHPQALASGRKQTVEYRIGHPKKDILITVSPFHDKNGEIAGTVHVGRDITENRRIQAMVRESEEKFRTLFETLPIPVYLWQEQNKDFILTAYNKSAETITRGKIRDALGAKAHEFFTSGFEDQLNILETCFRQGEGVRKQAYCTLRTTGERKFFDICTVFLPPDMVMVITIDLSERRQMEEELIRAREATESASRIKSEFLANMSHEFRTPLNGILGYTQILRQDEFLTGSQRDAIDIIHRSGEHLLLLINDILDISRTETGTPKTEVAAFCLPAFLKTIAEIARIQSHQKSIFFKYEAERELPDAVLGDEKRLRQVLLNLLNNAIKFTDRGGVALRVREQGPEVRRQGKKDTQQPATSNQQPATSTTRRIRFEVSDTGIGIPPEKLEDIFTPFHQEKGDKAHISGTGLGLAISRKLVRMMGGKLCVKSTVGQGSTFWFDLDMEEAKLPTPAIIRKSKKVVGYEGETRRILIADDVPMNRMILKKFLVSLGFRVRESADGKEVLEEAKTFRPDMIFMDIVMPVSDGFEASLKIREIPELKKVVIIAMSARVSHETQQVSLAAGCDDFIVKPVDFVNTLALLERHLGLEWIHKEEAPESSKKEEMRRIIPPPQEEIKGLLQLARVGDISGIRNQAEKLETLNPDFAPFADQIRELAKKFRIKKIKKFLKDFERKDKGVGKNARPPLPPRD